MGCNNKGAEGSFLQVLRKATCQGDDKERYQGQVNEAGDKRECLQH